MYKFIKSCLSNRGITLCFGLLLILFGTFSIWKSPVDVLPNLDRSVVSIISEAHGMVPEDVEKLISLPIEQSLNGAAGVKRVRSSSGLGLSLVYVEFDWKSDNFRNRQIVSEKMQHVIASLPKGVVPQLLPSSSIMGQIQKIGVYSKSNLTSMDELSNLIHLDLKYKLLAIQGVSKAIVAGGSPMQVQIVIDQNKLMEFGINFYEIAEILEKSNENAEGGFIKVGEKSPVISYRGRLQSIEDIENLLIGRYQDRNICIKDIGNISFAPSVMKIGDAGVNAKTGFTISILKQPGADTKEITKAIDNAILQFQKSAPEDVVIINDLFKQSDFIDRAIKNVIDAIRDGAILVIVVLLLFLGNIRSVVIALSAIPLSILTTAVIFSFFEISINTMTLGGVAVAIGALVDDAIVYMENTLRRLKEGSSVNTLSKADIIEIILSSSHEIRNPVLVSTIIVILVYLPLFFLEGLEGRLFTPIGVAYVLSIICSYFVAIVFTPVLCFYLLPTVAKKSHGHDTFVVKWLKNIVEKIIRISVKRAYFVLASVAVVLVFSLWLVFSMGTQFLPPFNEGVAQVNLSLPPETGIQFSSEIGKKLEECILKIDGVKNVSRNTGRAEGDEHSEGSNTSELFVTFKEDSSKNKEEILDEIRKEVAEKLPGVNITLDQPLQHLISHAISGVKAPIAIKIYGEDISILREIANKIKIRIEKIDGLKDLFVEQLQFTDVLAIKPNFSNIFNCGIEESNLRESVAYALGSESTNQIFMNGAKYPLVMSLNLSEGQIGMNDINDLVIFDEEKQRHRLEELAEINWKLTPTNINRENMSRRLVIQANSSGRSNGEIVNDIKKELSLMSEDLKKYKGYSVVIGGNYEAQEAATKKILILSILAVFFMGIVLLIYYRSLVLCVQVLLAIPMACIGAIVLLKLTGSVISIATLVGFISLGGIAARNVILLIDHYLHLARVENFKFSVELIVKGSLDRMMPVLMTALCSAIALVPLALSPNEPGKEILYPVAIVILGGLVSSTLLDFIVTPACFWLYGEKEIKLKER